MSGKQGRRPSGFLIRCNLPASKTVGVEQLQVLLAGCARTSQNHEVRGSDECRYPTQRRALNGAPSVRGCESAIKGVGWGTRPEGRRDPKAGRVLKGQQPGRWNPRVVE